MTTDDIYVQLSPKPPFLPQLSTSVTVEPRMLLLTYITDTLVYFHIDLKSITSILFLGVNREA